VYLVKVVRLRIRSMPLKSTFSEYLQNLA
jgi:hypothetical protein